MSKFKMPSLFIKEIALLPRTISDIKTSIPVFIGLTRNASEGIYRSLLYRPIKIKSHQKFTEIFGYNSDLTNIRIELDDNDLVTDARGELNYFLSSCVLQFFKNGGRECYVISCGKFGTEPNFESINRALKIVSDMDEPSLIYIPDAHKLNEDDFYRIYKSTLNLCAEKEDKFAVLDLPQKENWNAGLEEFRQNIGSENLKFGAAYSPHLRAAIELDPGFDLVSRSVYKDGKKIEPEELVHDSDNLGRIYSLKDIYKDITAIEKDISEYLLIKQNNFLSEEFFSIHKRFLELCKSELESPNPNYLSVSSDFSQLVYQLYGIMEALLDKWNWENYQFSSYWLKDLIESTTASKLSDSVTKLNGNLKNTFKSIGTEHLDEIYKTAFSWKSALFKNLNSGVIGLNSFYLFLNASEPSQYIENMRTASYKLSEINKSVVEIIEFIRKELYNAAHREERFLENGLSIYKSIKDRIRNAEVVIPPGGAVCGAYAENDRTKGFWRAPANVTLSGVNGLTIDIGISEQQLLYNDPNKRISINPIREFSKTNHVIWGARTLDAANPEFKYVPIQRSVMIIEKSIFRGTLWVMFEPNTSETWLKVSKTISDYLHSKFKEGMLQGLKPEQAYFVKVGLGTSMTPQDLKDGRFVIIYGIALLKPNDFFTAKIIHQTKNTLFGISEINKQ